MSTTKTVNEVRRAPAPHWVGDGFPVRTVFAAHAGEAAAISPFLMLDYAGPHDFPPATDGRPRGVDEHPHRGFETVTIVYQGEIEHRDSSGNSGKIGPGDVQWMTAASGVVHEEKHGTAFTQRGGTLEMIQLWVNLPAREKMSRPRYQEILDAAIPKVALAGDAGSVRVIAGAFDNHRGPATTVTPMDVWDIRMRRGGSASFQLPGGANALVLPLVGRAVVNGSQVNQHECAMLGRDGETLEINATDADATILLLSGQPIDEPVVAQGPFVMNTADEIRQAIQDYRSGRMGSLSAKA